MNLYLIFSSNDYFQTDKIEEFTDEDAAKVRYFQMCAAYTAEKSVIKGVIKIIDSDLNVYKGYETVIKHPQPEPEPTPEPEVTEPEGE